MPTVSSVSQTGVGVSTPLKFSRNERPRVAYTVNVTGTATYSIEHSLDGTHWVSNEDATALTVNADGNYQFPIYGIRLNVTAGTGTVTLVMAEALGD